MHLSRFLATTTLVVLGLTGAAGPLHAQKQKDAPPTLLSTTGGGGWSNLAELTQAAQGGNPRAQYELGENLLSGTDAPADRPKAWEWLEKSARAGHGPAAFRIGKLLADGEGMTRDLARAIGYYRAAAAGGVGEAFYNIGAAYASARGVKRDFAEALGWLIAARAHGAPSEEGESAVRAQIERLKRPEWIKTGEERAKTIDAELATKPVAAWLPPAAPFATTTAPAGATVAPGAAGKP